jgi:hypothetical protein
LLWVLMDLLLGEGVAGALQVRFHDGEVEV